MEISWEEVCSFRSKLYSFFGTCFLEPLQAGNGALMQRKFWTEFPLEAANLKMQGGLDKLIQCTELLAKLPPSQAMQEIQLEYTHLFLGPGQPKAPPWESVYRTPEKLLFGWPTLRVREAYRRNGFEIRLKNRQPEDHMGLELMFLATMSDSLGRILTVKGNQASVASMIKSQLEFLTNHPLTWIADFFHDASMNESAGFYPGLIELIWGIMLWDLELLQEMLKEFPTTKAY